jgi:hypothetical protein
MTFNHISKMLSRHIKSVDLHQRKIPSFIWPVKDDLGLRTPGVYNLPANVVKSTLGRPAILLRPGSRSTSSTSIWSIGINHFYFSYPLHFPSLFFICFLWSPFLVLCLPDKGSFFHPIVILTAVRTWNLTKLCLCLSQGSLTITHWGTASSSSLICWSVQTSAFILLLWRLCTHDLLYPTPLLVVFTALILSKVI